MDDTDKLNLLIVITAHEEKNCLFDLLRNIKYFTSELSVGFVIHICPTLYTEILENELRSEFSNIWICPNRFEKKTLTVGIYKAHIDAMNYILELDLKFDVLQLLASNCLYIRQFTLEKLKLSQHLLSLNINTNEGKEQYKKYGVHLSVNYEINDTPEEWHYPVYKKDPIFNKLVNDLKTQVCGCLHEGQIFLPSHIKYLVEIDSKYGLSDNLYYNACWEEIIYSSLLLSLGVQYIRTCRIFLDHYTENGKVSDEILEKALHGDWNLLVNPHRPTEHGHTLQTSVKAITRNYNDTQRTLVREYCKY